ncbi:MAG: ABC transporter substrate-binding protein [Xanthomonadaceae bacterium]|nr:ABC transporter substrate-binding protein [Xanthomonadaceae bacterium]
MSNNRLFPTMVFFFCCLIIILIPGLAKAGDSPLQKVTFIPQWVPQAQFAGYYVALETGIYQKYGLDVTIISGGPHRSSADYLKDKKADFASFWLATGLELCNRGVPVVNLAQIVQRSALMLIAKKKNGIFKPGDMEGHKVGLWGPPFDVQPKIFFKQYGLTIKPVRQSYSINLFLRDGVTIASAMWYNEYHRIINAGIDPDELTTFFFSDHGLNYPEDGIYVRQQTWQQKPELCRAFVNASLQGWQRAFAEPKLALDIVMHNLKKAHVITNRAHQEWMLKRMRDIILPPDSRKKMGSLNKEDFQRVVDGLVKQEIIKKAPPFQVFYQNVAGE